MLNRRANALLIIALVTAGLIGCADRGSSARSVDHTMPGPDRGANPAPGDNPARAVNPGTDGDNGAKP